MFWVTGPLLRFRAFLPAKLFQASDRFSQRLPLPSDQYGIKFVFAVVAVLVFTLLAYGSLLHYRNVQWYVGEDGVSEWWSVVTYLAAAVMTVITARVLGRLGHSRLGLFHLLLAVLFLVGMMEEISWGQRLFGWSTPEVFARINEQDETTIHNMMGIRGITATVIFCVAFLALAGAVVRAVLHHRRWVTTADFILPSLVLSPALLAIMFWIAAGYSVPGNIAQMLLVHFTTEKGGVLKEVVEVLMGLCLILYTYGNVRRAARLGSVDHPLASKVKAET